MDIINRLGLVGKASLDSASIALKRKEGFKHLELQILKKDNLLDCVGIADRIHNLDVDILTVHTILDPNMGEVNLTEILLDDEWFNKLIQALELAEEFALLQKHPVNVIIHNRDSIKMNYYLIKECRNRVGTLADLMSTRYEDTRILIENPSAFGYDHGNVYFNEGYNMAGANAAAKYLSQIIPEFSNGMSRVGTVLDTCHFLMTQQSIYAVRNAIPSNFPVQTLESEMMACKDTIVQFHLANMHQTGTEPWDHGCGFGPNPLDRGRLKSFFDKRASICPETFVVLELREDNYLNPINVEETLVTLRQMYG